MSLLLASASPRRRELLFRLGVGFDFAPADLDETPRVGESAEALVDRLALAKAGKIAMRRADWVLAADTAVALGQQIFGKPRDVAESVDMLERLSGVEHRVITAVALVRGQATERAIVASRVWFRPLSEEDIRRYADGTETGEAAGGYAIQGGAAPFIARLVGSYSNVVGLPLGETAALLARAGLLA